MVVMYTTVAVIMGRLLCLVHPLGPVRERLSRNLEDWVYSKKGVTLDILVNIIIVAVSVSVLVCTAREKPNVLVSFSVWVWVGLPAVQCLVHVVLVLVEYRRLARMRRRRGELDLKAVANCNGNGSVGDDGIFCSLDCGAKRSFAYRCDYWNLITSLVWVIVGACLVPSPSRDMLPPWLYRLTVIYQTYDITFVMLYLAGIFVCFSLSCVFANRHNDARQKQEEKPSNEEKPSIGAGVMVPMNTCSGDSATECVTLPDEDAECCICLCSNDDGIDLRALSCNHRFHATCIEKWLKINATCPVCNSNILKGSVCV